MIDQLISPSDLRRSGLWREGEKPSVRTLQNWIYRRCLPCVRHGRRRYVPMVELQKTLKADHRWPCAVAHIPSRPLLGLGLIRFDSLCRSSIWHPGSRPCARTLRTWVRHGEIPHYRVGRSVFFSPEEVEHCLITAKLVAAA